MTKTAAQIAHEQRNADAKAAAAQAKAARVLAHRTRNFNASVDGVQRRDQRMIDGIERNIQRNADISIAAASRRADRIAAHEARNEAAALASATLAFAQEVEARFGIVANDNAALSQAA